MLIIDAIRHDDYAPLSFHYDITIITPLRYIITRAFARYYARRRHFRLRCHYLLLR